MNKALMVVVPAAVGLGVGLLLATDDIEATPSLAEQGQKEVVIQHSGTDHSEELLALRREVRALSQAQSELGAMRGQVPPPTSESSEVDEDPGPDPSLDPQAAIDANMAALVEQAVVLEQWFDDQGSDPEWTPSAEKSLHAAFSNVDGLSFDADCVASACRLDLGFADTDARDNTMSQVPFMMPWSGEGFVATLDEEGLAITVYVAREGTTLPRSG